MTLAPDRQSRWREHAHLRFTRKEFLGQMEAECRSPAVESPRRRNENLIYKVCLNLEVSTQGCDLCSRLLSYPRVRKVPEEVPIHGSSRCAVKPGGYGGVERADSKRSGGIRKDVDLAAGPGPPIGGWSKWEATTVVDFLVGSGGVPELHVCTGHLQSYTRASSISASMHEVMHLPHRPSTIVRR